MKPVDRTTPSQAESITLEFDLHHPPAKVWRALTEPALLTEWLLPTLGYELQPGAAFTLQAPPQPGWNGTVNCTFVEIEVERKLSLTWVVGDLDTVVTFTLAPAESGTRLTLVHTGFRPDQKQAFGGARYGWKMMGERLVDLLGRTA
jgi:uncharacterized protein YndB with AHSA1/START domain